MPTYRNVTSNIEVIHSVKFPPGQDIEVEFYINHPSIKEIKEEPIYSPVAYSEQISSGSVKITPHLTPEVTALRILASTGSSASICFNDSSNPVVVISPHHELVLRPVFKYKEIFVKSGSVSVELWKEFCWRN